MDGLLKLIDKGMDIAIDKGDDGEKEQSYWLEGVRGFYRLKGKMMV